MAKVIYLAHLSDRAAVVRTIGTTARYPVREHRLLFAFSDKAAAQDFCRRQTHIDGADPWKDGPWEFESVDPETRQAKEAWIDEVPLDPTPTLPGMEDA